MMSILWSVATAGRAWDLLSLHAMLSSCIATNKYLMYTSRRFSGLDIIFVNIIVGDILVSSQRS